MKQMKRSLHDTDSGNARIRPRRRRPKLNPWRDSFELDWVGSSLLGAGDAVNKSVEVQGSSEYQDLVSALELVRVWRFRSNDKLPHSIDTTACLATCLVRDIMDKGRRSNVTELRLAYSSAIVRGVNGLADVLQQSRAVATSIALLCDSIGLPGWIVDVRHEAAHNELPSLSVLRLAAQTFLGFLEERFWKPLREARESQRREASRLLQQYGKALDRGDESSLQVINVNEDERDGSDQDDQPKQAPQDLDEMDMFLGEILGQESNRYAVLMDEPKTKVHERSAKSKQSTKQSWTFASFIDMFISNTTPDVGFHVLLSFMVWGENGAGHGVLIPNIEDFSMTDAAVDAMIDRYGRRLIVPIVIKWPGFLPALLVHLVDFFVKLKDLPVQNPDSSTKSRKEYFTKVWIDYLLSRDFHKCNHSDLSSHRVKGTMIQLDTKTLRADWTHQHRTALAKPAPLHVLRAANVPLLSLEDRCTQAGADELSRLFRAVLADEDLESEKADPKMMSLSQIEVMLESEEVELSDEKRSKGKSSETRSTRQSSSPWSLCDEWEPCALGAMPGYPV